MIFYCPQIKWSIRLPAGFTVKDQTQTTFFCRHDKYNHLSATVTKIGEREPCGDTFTRLFPSLPGTAIERAASAISVGGKFFDLQSFLITKNGIPVYCFECIFHTLGEYELSIAMTYNDETRRVLMCRSLDGSHFG